MTEHRITGYVESSADIRDLLKYDKDESVHRVHLVLTKHPRLFPWKSKKVEIIIREVEE